MKFYVNIEDTWFAVPCHNNKEKISHLIDDVISRYKETGIKINEKVEISKIIILNVFCLISEFFSKTITFYKHRNVYFRL